MVRRAGIEPARPVRDKGFEEKPTLVVWPSFRFLTRFQGAVEPLSSRSKGFVQPAFQDLSGRQFRKVFRDSNATFLKLQQFNMLVRLPGTKDQAQR